MKPIRGFLWMSITLGAAGWVLAQAEAGKADGDIQELRALRQQVESLQTRIKKLEERLTEVESTKSQQAPRIQILPKPPGGSPSLRLRPGWGRQRAPRPEVWEQREINGWDFHIIPCGDE